MSKIGIVPSKSVKVGVPASKPAAKIGIVSAGKSNNALATIPKKSQVPAENILVPAMSSTSIFEKAK